MKTTTLWACSACAGILIAIAVSGFGQAPVQPSPISSSVTVDTNLHIVTIQASFFQSNLDTLLPAILGVQTGTNAFSQIYQLNLVSNLLANATNTIFAQIAAIKGSALTNGGTNYSLVAQANTNLAGWLTVTNLITANNLNVTNQITAGSGSFATDLYTRDGISTNNWRAGTLTVDHDATGGGNLTVSSNILADHFGGIVTVPPVAVAGTGAGTTPTITLDANANDTAMTLNVTAGTSPGTSATIVTVTFGKPYTTAPHVFMTPGNPTAASLAGGSAPSVLATSVSTSSFVLTSGPTAITNAAVYRWNFLVVQ